MMKNLSNENTRYMLDVIAYTLYTQNPLLPTEELDKQARQIMSDYCIADNLNADYTDIWVDVGDEDDVDDVDDVDDDEDEDEDYSVENFMNILSKLIG